MQEGRGRGGGGDGEGSEVPTRKYENRGDRVTRQNVKGGRQDGVKAGRCKGSAKHFPTEVI